MRVSTLNTTLTNQELYALLALSNKTLHGYGVRDQIAADSEGTLGRATISHWYRLASAGRQRLASEITRLERVIKHARYKLGQSPF
jgi:hypothetical protein